eukprot:GHVO01044975.1.p1 GENE.GHVO01044975.1~~GHVO01044975.1.p1  ORF type:complete len:278 (+),score=45.87 GHVO01044975.1:510-1343(+)
MSEIAKLIEVLQAQMTQQQEQQQQQLEQQQQQLELQQCQHQEDKEEMQRRIDEQLAQQREQMDIMKTMLGKSPAPLAASTSSSTPTFAPFDATAELWTDYWARFCTFTGANSVPDDRKAQVFLTNQTSTVYKLLASQQTPPKDINKLTMDEIVNFMKDQFDPKRFTIRERFKFWSELQRKPGETIQELAARIRQDAATCDFSSIQDPQDEALRTRFIRSVGNEAILKALFKIKDDDLTFARAIQIAIETEDAAKVAKETVHGSRPKPVNKVQQWGPR